MELVDLLIRVGQKVLSLFILGLLITLLSCVLLGLLHVQHLVLHLVSDREGLSLIPIVMKNFSRPLFSLLFLLLHLFNDASRNISTQNLHGQLDDLTLRTGWGSGDMCSKCVYIYIYIRHMFLLLNIYIYIIMHSFI